MPVKQLTPTAVSSSAEAASPLRIVHAVLSLDMGGLERIVVDLAREGKQHGHTVSIVCLERPGTLARQAQALGVPVCCAYKRPGVRLRVRGEVADQLAQLRPDVVHTHQVTALFYAGPAARRVGVPLVVHTEHGKHYAARWRTRLLGRLAGRHARRFFCVSQDIADEVNGFRVVDAAKVCVVPNGIDIERFARRGAGGSLRQSLGIPASAPVVGTVGRATEIKRQDALLRAFARLRERFPDAHLLLVGDGPLLPQLKQLADELGVGKAAHFPGNQLQPEKYLHLMDVFALTSRSEGMPVSVLEAWASGVPVVAAAVGGLPEMIRHGETGLLYPPGDENGLVASLTDILGRPDAARRLAAAGRRHVEDTFSRQRMFGVYERHYRELLVAR